MSYYNYYEDWDEPGECIICGELTQCIEHDFCYECFCEIRNLKYMYSNSSQNELIDLYNKRLIKAKENINKLDIIEFQKEMFALAENEDEKFYGGYLLPHLLKDIEEIKSLKNKKDFANNFRDNDYRQKWPAEYQCDDGHYVRSPYELIIDNWLHHHNYKHEYEKSVFMKNAPDEIVLSDFYLPEENIYIEFWGIEENEKYKNRKEQKIKLYDENKLKRIDLTKNDIKRLNDILPRLIQNK